VDPLFVFFFHLHHLRAHVLPFADNRGRTGKQAKHARNDNAATNGREHDRADEVADDLGHEAFFLFLLFLALFAVIAVVSLAGVVIAAAAAPVDAAAVVVPHAHHALAIEGISRQGQWNFVAARGA